MDIWMIWVRDSADPAATLWLDEAWDDDAIMGNPEGWADAKDKAYKAYGGDNVVIAATTVDFATVQTQFIEPVRI